MEPQIGKLYRAIHHNIKSNTIDYQRDNILVVIAMKELLGEPTVLFHYLDDPEEICEWNYYAFQDGMVEL